MFDDPVEDLVEPADAPVLPLDPAELHASNVTGAARRHEL
jgi:hypothetical protein